MLPGFLEGSLECLYVIHLPPSPPQGLAGSVATFLKEDFILMLTSDAYDRMKRLDRTLALESKDRSFTPGKMY